MSRVCPTLLRALWVPPFPPTALPVSEDSSLGKMAPGEQTAPQEIPALTWVRGDPSSHPPLRVRAMKGSGGRWPPPALGSGPRSGLLGAGQRALVDAQ